MTTPARAMSPLKRLLDFGQSVWLDYIRRDLITSGELARLVAEDGLRGMTSNPAIFEKAITGIADYQRDLTRLRESGVTDPIPLYEAVAIADIQAAADALSTVYRESSRRDGYVSLEVSPFLARDTERTIVEARRLWKAVGRPNLMIKVPATDQGVPAIRALISEGINVNVTLLFAQARYEAVALAYLDGLEALAATGADLGGVASVASFFVSRIDTLVDARLAALRPGTEAGRARTDALKGRVAIANAKLAYRIYERLVASPRWKALEARGAQRQRLLWASTSTKNPAYRDVMYVEELIGPDTVNTIPPATFDAFRDHGQVRASLTEKVDEAAEVMTRLGEVGISMDEVTATLIDDAVRLFVEPFEKLLDAVSAPLFGPEPDLPLNPQRVTLADSLQARVDTTLEAWRWTGAVHRLWARDAALWTGRDEANWLGWLTIVGEERARQAELASFAAEVRQGGFTDILLLGMGGSSLCVEVLAECFGRQPGAPALHVLDSTDPAQVRAVERRVPLATTLFIVSSKSGSTLEPNIFQQYFRQRVSLHVGPRRAEEQFVAITDPGSSLQALAEREAFRRTFPGKPSIGGRYSALSPFGLVPAAAAGIDLSRLLDNAEAMVRACSPLTRAPQNPGVLLGVVLGLAALEGRDKLTLVTSPGIRDLGAWLEQLVAESTGKAGRAIVPVDRETPGDPRRYGDDRVFVHLRHAATAQPAEDAAVEALGRAGHPVVRIDVDDPYGLGQEFFRWEIATAVAGAILGINPFDQPDVEASKIATRRLTADFETTGALPEERPFFEDASMALYADAANRDALLAAVGQRPSFEAIVDAHVRRLAARDYFAVLAYVDMNEANGESLQRLRHQVRDRTKAATCLGFGPRFLHSTGQAYKGGPNTGVFLQVTCDDPADLAVPGSRLTFGVVKAAQARGDFEVLAARGRRALRTHVKGDVASGLERLAQGVRP